MEENKELWQGSGLWLDFRNINDGDRAKVERRLEEIGELKAQIVFLEKLKTTYIHALDEIFDDFKELEEAKRREYQKQGALPDSARSQAKRNRLEFTDRGKRFELWLIGKLKYLNNMLKIETEAQSAREPGEDPASDTAAEQVKKLTLAQRVWAIHYLLIEAGMSYAVVDKTEVARFIAALTGDGFDNVYKRVRNKYQKNEKATQRDLAAVRAQFERLGMFEIVEKIDKERNIG
jgi:hypothetical protein